MDYRSFDGTVYVRLDTGEEIIGSLLEVCRKEKIASAVFSGIGGCSRVEIQTFIPENGTFETRVITGTLEMVALNGNVTSIGEGEYNYHAHALLTYIEDGEHRVAGGHLKSAAALYTSEIELRPVTGGVICGKHDPETGTRLWSFED